MAFFESTTTTISTSTAGGILHWWVWLILFPAILLAMTGQALALSSSSSSSTLSSSSVQQPPSLSSTTSLPWTISSTTTKVHLVILIHGWLGSPAEMNSIQQALYRVLASSSDTQHAVLIHSVECNEGKTSDGIIMGGARVAEEINDKIQQLLLSSLESGEESGDAPQPIALQNMTLSFIGNSLGGLYARAALPDITWKLSIGKDDAAREIELTPNVFCTTCTPHLGKRGLTYLPLPRIVETSIGYALQPTGQDLFGVTSVIQDLATLPKYLQPLAQFQKRIAYANAFGTDLQVPTATAAFLADTESPHVTQKPTTPSLFRLTVTTPRDDEMLQQTMQACSTIVSSQKTIDDDEDSLNKAQPQSSMTTTTTPHFPASSMARTLDAMGWTKVFCDVRDKLISVPIPFARKGKNGQQGSSSTFEPEPLYTSHQLKQIMANRIDYDQKWPLPFGHTMLIANAKSEWYATLNRGGLEFVEQMARDFVHDVLQQDDDNHDDN